MHKFSRSVKKVGNEINCKTAVTIENEQRDNIINQWIHYKSFIVFWAILILIQI